MKVLCTKARPAVGAYTDADGQATPARCFVVMLRPVVSQHDTPGGVGEIQLTLWGHAGHACQYEESKTYELRLERG